MYGLDAISANNGWQLAALGISIVFAGLIVLSFSISQIHRVLEFFDKSSGFSQRIKKAGREKNISEPDVADSPLPAGIKESAFQFKLLIKHIGEPFSLPELIDFSKKCGLLHSHLRINDLLQTNLIIPDGKGYFLWNYEVEKTLRLFDERGE